MTDQQKRIEAIAKALALSNASVFPGLPPEEYVNLHWTDWTEETHDIITADPATKELQDLRAEVERLKKGILLAARWFHLNVTNDDIRSMAKAMKDIYDHTQ